MAEQPSFSAQLEKYLYALPASALSEELESSVFSTNLWVTPQNVAGSISAYLPLGRCLDRVGAS